MRNLSLGWPELNRLRLDPSFKQTGRRLREGWLHFLRTQRFMIVAPSERKKDAQGNTMPSILPLYSRALCPFICIPQRRKPLIPHPARQCLQIAQVGGREFHLRLLSQEIPPVSTRTRASTTDKERGRICQGDAGLSPPS